MYICIYVCLYVTWVVVVIREYKCWHKIVHVNAPYSKIFQPLSAYLQKLLPSMLVLYRRHVHAHINYMKIIVQDTVNFDVCAL